jgi:hypothetical protein
MGNYAGGGQTVKTILVHVHSARRAGNVCIVNDKYNIENMRVKVGEMAEIKMLGNRAISIGPPRQYHYMLNIDDLHLVEGAVACTIITPYDNIDRAELILKKSLDFGTYRAQVIFVCRQFARAVTIERVGD